MPAGRSATALALFDLDHTLIPFDSGLAWLRLLIRHGQRPAAAEAEYLDHCHQYVAGTLDIHAMHRSALAPLAHWTLDEFAPWQARFRAEIEPLIPAQTRAWVAAHQAAGELCALVTATSRLVAAPLAAAFGFEHLLCTEPQLIADARGRLRPNGEIAGTPCFRAHKIAHVEAWLSARGEPALAAWPRSHFYSDSASDLPLLQAVSHPVAVRPDARLRAVAQERGWPVID